MASDWDVVKFKELYLIPSRNGLSKPKKVRGEGVKFINMGEIFKFDRMFNIPTDRVPVNKKEFDSSELRDNDLLFARQSLVLSGAGKCAIFLGDNEPVVFESHLIRVRPDEKKVYPEYLYYFFKSPQGRSEIWSITEQGAGQSGIRGSDLENINVPMPSHQEQKAIAHILGSLDDKIELNRQMNETLEAMAQALFKSWFVDFDPVLDNALAAGHAIPDEFSERAKQRQAVEKTDNSDIHKLFPDEFELTEEMGWIPKGWIVDDISSLCEKIQSGGTPRRNVPEYWEDGTIPWLTSGEVRQTIIIKVENKISESGLTNSSAKWLASGATVVAMYGATAGQVAYIDKPLTTNQAVCGLIPKKGYQFFNYVTLSRAVAHFEGRATGSAQQNINKGMIESTRVVVPCSISSDSFEEYCEVIFSKWIKNLHENETLTKLRDTLLPKLMSGELRIADAAAMVN